MKRGREGVCSRTATIRLKKETLFEFFAGGGGGFGSPLLRDVEAVREDVVNGVVSITSAKRDYGVIIDPSTLKVDHELTKNRREQMSKRSSKDAR